jgi:hypothetical protein
MVARRTAQVLRADAKELEALGTARGTAIRDALAKEGIDPLRLFLSSDAPITGRDNRERFELKLR